ncbi:MAG TPA: hypothetical protein VEJ17_00360, partial [Candidatus Nitrosotalea sp.]|nr:hypothetical protein [Candidatus Nitrosotalea sp.]
TALCLAALIDSGWVRASDATALRRFWRQPTGPFSTCDPIEFEHLPNDPVVNCNVLYCLRLGAKEISDRERQAVSESVIHSLNSREHYSAFYRSKTTLVYAAARAGLDASILTACMLAVRSAPLDAQGMAEVLAAVPGLNSDLVGQLLLAQQSDGRWLGTPWFFDHVGDFCSDAYATAVVIEGLSHWGGPSPMK